MAECSALSAAPRNKSQPQHCGQGAARRLAVAEAAHGRDPVEWEAASAVCWSATFGAVRRPVCVPSEHLGCSAVMAPIRQPARRCTKPHFRREVCRDAPSRALPSRCGSCCQRPDKPAMGSNVETAKPSARFARISGNLRSSHSRAFFWPSSNSSWRNSGEVLNLLDAS
jgi:hypothetical protein